MNKVIVFRNRILYVMSVIVFFWGVISLVFIGFAIYNGAIVDLIVLLAIGAIILFTISLYLFAWGSATVLIDDAGVRAVSVVLRSNYFTDWENLNYAYYVNNHRGGYFWIISSEPLVKKDIRRMVLPPDFYYKKNIYIVTVTPIKEKDELTKMLENKVAHLEYICEYPKYY